MVTDTPQAEFILDHLGLGMTLGMTEFTVEIRTVVATKDLLDGDLLTLCKYAGRRSPGRDRF